MKAGSIEKAESRLITCEPHHARLLPERCAERYLRAREFPGELFFHPGTGQFFEYKSLEKCRHCPDGQARARQYGTKITLKKGAYWTPYNRVNLLPGAIERGFDSEKEWLHDMLHIRGLTFKEAAQEAGIRAGTIRDHARKFGLDARGRCRL